LKKILLFVLILLFSVLNAYEFSPRVSTYEGRELKWENGSYRHYVLFQEVLSSFGRCPEDPEYYEKTFYYTSIPLDIDLQKAFLIWTSFQLPSQINEPTDSSVTLNFYGEGKSYKLTQVVEASDSYLISEPQGFEFDSLVSPEDPSRSYFTYRVDITEFIDEILGRRPENGAHSGSFYLEDLNCNYVPDIYPKGTEVGSWAIIMIYEEPESPRNSREFTILTRKILTAADRRMTHVYSLQTVLLPILQKLKTTG